MRVLITGKNSFIGTNFCKFSDYKDVTKISLREVLPELIEFSKYNVVIHLAAIVHQSKKISEDEYFRINRDLAINVARHAKDAGVKQFIFLSTLKVYGSIVIGSEFRNEGTCCFPDDAYGRSKYAAEKGLKKLEDNEFTVSIIRTPLVYGEGVTSNMFSLIKLVDSIHFLPFDRISNKRNFTYTENLIGFIDRIIEKRASGIFIAMDTQAISTTDLINYISKYLGKKVTLFKLPGFIIKLGTWIRPQIFDRLYNSFDFDNSYTRTILEYSPPYTTEEGIGKTISFYLKCKFIEECKKNISYARLPKRHKSS